MSEIQSEREVFFSRGRKIQKFETRVIDGEEYKVPSRDWKNLRDQTLCKINLEKSSLPPHVADLRLDEKSFLIESDLDQRGLLKAQDFTRNFESRHQGNHLYIWSSKNGTQKTTLAATIGKELAEQGHFVEFILMSELTRLLTSEDFRDYNERTDRVRYCDVLIIDDSFDTRKMTVYKSGYQIPYLDTFLRNRLEGKRQSTIFTSNVHPESINEEVFGTSLVRLVNRSVLAPIEFSTPWSRRNDFDPNNLWIE